MDQPPRSLRLAFAGTPPFAVAALDALCAGRHRVLAVFTQSDRPAGRGRALQASAVKQRALELGLPVHQPLSFKAPDARARLAALSVDVFVVVAYGLILPPDVLAVPPLGCLNIHASLLPRWRGAAPIERALLAGDARSGVTIMRMDAGLDTGPMLAARAIDIDGRDTGATLTARLAALGAELICATLDELAAGRAGEVPQPEAGVTYAAKIDKAEALLDWREDAATLARKVRAFNPRPVAETRHRGAQLRIWEALDVTAAAGAGTGTVATTAGTGGADAGATSAAPAAPGTVLAATAQGIDVACGRGILRLTRLQAPGRKPLDARQFLNAEPLAGARFGSP